MWLFGYGSLMWDDWEKRYDGEKHAGAVLHGYSRAFNKKSVPELGIRDESGANARFKRMKKVGDV